ncbi:MAG TPA: CoA-binding protein, partial [Thermoplasmatales archaeon]|nr:CoA-binding protein [Thermoplasmatales archaeon]
MRKSPDLKYLFEPRSVAVIGASKNPEKIGYRILSNIIHGGYKGEVYPVNVKGGEILGKKVYRSVEEIDGEIDLSIIAIPAPYVYDAVK